MATKTVNEANRSRVKCYTKPSRRKISGENPKTCLPNDSHVVMFDKWRDLEALTDTERASALLPCA
jgi:hypothetical protein